MSEVAQRETSKQGHTLPSTIIGYGEVNKVSVGAIWGPYRSVERGHQQLAVAPPKQAIWQSLAGATHGVSPSSPFFSGLLSVIGIRTVHLDGCAEWVV
jgi:hypothetical protein